jgi:hypothetical protein
MLKPNEVFHSHCTRGGGGADFQTNSENSGKQFLGGGEVKAVVASGILMLSSLDRGQTDIYTCTGQMPLRWVA